MITYSIKDYNDCLFAIKSFVVVVTTILIFNLINSNFLSIAADLVSNRGLTNDGGKSVDRNYLSVSYVMALIFSSFLYIGELKTNKEKSKIVFLIISFVLIVGIVIVGSRTGFVLLCFFLLYWIIVAIIKSQINYSRLIVILLLFTGLIMLLDNFNLLDLIIFRFLDEGSLEDGSGRLDIFESFIKGLSNIPFSNILFGSGYGAQYIITDGWDTHNDYLAFVASYGVVGLSFWLATLFRLLYTRFNTFYFGFLLIYLIGCLSLSMFMSLGAVISLSLVVSYSKLTSNEKIITIS